MILLEQYFGGKPHSTEYAHAAVKLLWHVDCLLIAARIAGFYRDEIDPDTGTCISGSKRGNGDGGFRLQTATTGRPLSKHKLAAAVDVFDPFNQLDGWLTDEILAKHGLYREHPDDTPGWCHLQTIPPGSGKRTFKP